MDRQKLLGWISLGIWTLAILAVFPYALAISACNKRSSIPRDKNEKESSTFPTHRQTTPTETLQERQEGRRGDYASIPPCPTPLCATSCDSLPKHLQTTPTETRQRQEKHPGDNTILSCAIPLCETGPSPVPNICIIKFNLLPAGKKIPPKKLPRTVSEAARTIISQLSAEEQELVRSAPVNNLFVFHHGWGTQIRNDLGLWGRNRDLLANCGTSEPDNCSFIIIKEVWKQLQHKPVRN